MKIFFRYGKNANLSHAEVAAVLKLKKLSFEVVAANKFAGIFEIPGDKKVDLKELQSRLGGTVKIGQIFATASNEDLRETLRMVIAAELNKVEGKKFFGLSVVGQPPQGFKAVSAVNGFALQIKKELEGSCRVVSSKEIELSSVIVEKEKLLTRGGDFNVITIDGNIFIGKTAAVQEFREFGRRDYARPEIDAKSGMLPPKLARVMINLAGQRLDAVLCDPFCGSGTLVSEMLVLGYRTIFASDLSPKAVADSRINLDWISKNYQIDISGVTVAETDAQKLSLKEKIDAIVTEPYLGPALRGGESRDVINRIRQELENLYTETMHAFARNVKEGGVVVMVVPAFVMGKEVLNLDLEEAIARAGFKMERDYENLENLPFRYPLMYQREGQKVVREILVLRKI